jgi:hypothetical protein
MDGAAPIHPDPNDAVSVMAGVLKRFGSAPPTASAYLLKEVRLFTEHTLKKWSRKYGLKKLESKSYDVDDWLLDVQAPQRRKDELKKASEEKYDPIKHRRVHMFVKDEFYDPDNVFDNKYLRLINSVHDVFKCRVGPVFKRIEMEVFKLPFFIKKIAVAERMEYIKNWLYRPGWQFYCNDYTAYETSFTAELMWAIEFELYKFMSPDDAQGRMFLNDIKALLADNKCYSKFIAANISATRMSGEQNTSLGNGFANVILILFCAAKSNVRARLCVEGDDSTISASGPLDVNWLKNLGLQVKLETHPSLGEMSFCGLLQADGSDQNVTDPRKVLVKFGWSNMRYVGCSDKTQQALVYAKALSYAHEYPHCPVIRPLCDWVFTHIKPNKYKMMRYINKLETHQRNKMLLALDNSSKIPEYAPSQVTRDLMERLFNVTVSQQLSIETYFDEAPYGVIHLPQLDVKPGNVRNWLRYVSNVPEFTLVSKYMGDVFLVLKRVECLAINPQKLQADFPLLNTTSLLRVSRGTKVDINGS